MIHLQFVNSAGTGRPYSGRMTILDERNRQKATAFEVGDIPSKFQFNVGGFTGASYEVELKDQAIEYTWSGSRNNRRGAERVTPDADQWRAFRGALEELGFWSWGRQFLDLDVVDGTNWSVLIYWGHQRIESGGSNEFPPKFWEVLKAVSGLIGGRVFR